MLLVVLVWKAAERPAKGHFRTQVKTFDIVDIEVQADNILTGRQTIFETDKPLVRTIADIAVRTFDIKEHWFALTVNLEI